ncbi:hypothetical protein [Flammeovirga sp. SJP92]|uniref:hypothetical protein n=1 Tax=Flammeovirga sp. SJP92 TaxID=1775430 RepID=UPI00078929F6|nr:hypothetical protein [Flammeovirga sp. SJP92]KXX69274.1 hypothetical protein AVL50_19850 [Flammeovirga sp. SJP92]
MRTLSILFLISIFALLISCDLHEDKVSSNEKKKFNGMVTMKNYAILESSYFSKFDTTREEFLTITYNDVDPTIVTFNYEAFPKHYIQYTLDQSGNQLKKMLVEVSEPEDEIEYTFDSERVYQIDDEDFVVKKFNWIREKYYSCCFDCKDTLSTIYVNKDLGVLQEYFRGFKTTTVLVESNKTDNLSQLFNAIKKDKAFYPDEKEIALRKEREMVKALLRMIEEEDLEIDFEEEVELPECLE